MGTKFLTREAAETWAKRLADETTLTNVAVAPRGNGAIIVGFEPDGAGIGFTTAEAVVAAYQKYIKPEVTRARERHVAEMQRQTYRADFERRVNAMIAALRHAADTIESQANYWRNLADAPDSALTVGGYVERAAETVQHETLHTVAALGLDGLIAQVGRMHNVEAKIARLSD